MKQESFRHEWQEIWQQFASDPVRAKKRNSWWEGDLVYGELAEGGMTQRAIPPEGTPMLRLLLQHLRYFKSIRRDAIRESKRYGEAASWFQKAATVFSQHNAADRSFDDWERRLRQEAWFRKQEQQEFWKLRLLPYDRSSWKRRAWIYGDTTWTQELPAPPSIVERAESVLNQVSYPQSYTSVANLHTWLQIRLAVVFKLFLYHGSLDKNLPHGLTTKTAARLVVLLYGCADLGKPCENAEGKYHLEVPDLPRPITVGGVYEKLHRYGVDTVCFSQVPIPEVLTKSGTPACASLVVIYCRDFPAVVQRASVHQAVKPDMLLHVVDEVVVERFQDSTVSVVFSPEYTEYQKAIGPEYKLVALFDGVG